MKVIKNFIGGIVRDIIVYKSNVFVEYFIQGEYAVYKTFLPFSFSIGCYKFLKEKDYFTLKVKNLVK